MSKSNVTSKIIQNLAMDFANYLSTGNFESAYGLLSTDLKNKLTPLILQQQYNQMTFNHNEPNLNIQTQIENTLDTWPTKLKNDCLWVYVSICSDYFSEAVALIISNEYCSLVVRDIEWGRP